jgi:hypothetical protein
MTTDDNWPAGHDLADWLLLGQERCPEQMTWYIDELVMLLGKPIDSCTNAEIGVAMQHHADGSLRNVKTLTDHLVNTQIINQTEGD